MGMPSSASAFAESSGIGRMNTRRVAARRGVAALLMGAGALVFASCTQGGAGSTTTVTDDGTDVVPPNTLYGPEVDDGQVVGSVRIQLPQEQQFTLRATMPLPRGFYQPEDSTLVPLSVLQSNGRAAPTQVNVVSRYPAENQGADVVEIVERVVRPPGTSIGDWASFKVASHPHVAKPYDVSMEIREMLAERGNVQLQTRDVFGHEYEADIYLDLLDQTGEAELIKKGELVNEYKTHEIMLPRNPQSGSQGTMPHLMGVHSFIRFFGSEDYFGLDLHVHNGMSGHDHSTDIDDALREIYFDELNLRLPQGWTLLQAYDNPFFGEAREDGSYALYPLIEAQSDGKLHMMPQQSRFWRRLIVAKTSAAGRARSEIEEKHLAFCEKGFTPSGNPNFSWWNRTTARYFPQAHRLPSIDHVNHDMVRQNLSNEFEEIRAQVASGDSGGYPFLSPNLGWAHPWGVAYGGMTGGDEIWLYDGVETAATASREGYRLSQLVGRAYIDRQPTALFNIDGNPTKVEDWLNPTGTYGPWLPMYFSLIPNSNSDPFGFDDAPGFQTGAAADQGRRPAYENELEDFMPIDLQHHIRYTRSMKILTWIGNDSLAKHELELAAELFRLSFHQYRNSNYNHIQGSGLLAKMKYVDDKPGEGLVFRRGEGWGTDAASAAYRVGTNEFRDRLYPWFKLIVETVRDGQSTCTGNIMAAGLNLLGGNYLIRQSFETAIVENALRGIKESVFRGRNATHTGEIDQIITNSAYASISAPFWSNSQNAPWFYSAVGPDTYNDPEYCHDVPSNAHSSHVDRSTYWSSFAYAHELTGDDVFIQRATEMTGGANLLNELEAHGVDGTRNRAALLAYCQTLEGVE